MSPEENKQEFLKLFDTYILPVREGALELREFLEKSSFFDDPASGRYHLNVPGGLCRHSLNVYYSLCDLAALVTYGDSGNGCPTELETTVAIVSLLHDLCKIGCYKQEPRNQKTYDPEKVRAAGWGVKHDQLGDFIWETVLQYKFDDPMPLGHGEKSVMIIMDHMKLTEEEKFCIRYHMGPWQDGEKNNVGKAFELYPLAALTHMADMMATYYSERES